jgi:hypothetical protein
LRRVSDPRRAFLPAFRVTRSDGDMPGSAKFNGMSHAQWATKMAQLLEQKQVYGMIKGYNDKPEGAAANATATEKATLKDCINHHGVARSTILLSIEPTIQVEYMVVEDAKMLWETLASAYKPQLKLNFFEVGEDLWSIQLQDRRDVDNYASRIDRNIKNNNLCAGSSTTNTDDDMDTTKTIAKMSEQQHIVYLLHVIPRNDEWRVILELMIDQNAMMTTRPDEIVTKLVEMEAVMKSINGLAPAALLFAKKGGRGGGNGGKAGRGGKSPRRNRRGNNDDKKEKNFHKCFHCQQQRNTNGNCLSKQCGEHP